MLSNRHDMRQQRCYILKLQLRRVPITPVAFRWVIEPHLHHLAPNVLEMPPRVLSNPKQRIGRLPCLADRFMQGVGIRVELCLLRIDLGKETVRLIELRRVRREGAF